ncbi:MAG: hypothetical protein ACD_72C00169G0007 [uncultured bacterium]|uniref:Uncharacterized protein n=1 Tax=Candidatus Magasanikbacteria bacterium RIFOXYD2_FULL_36_9 TaxID=1798707 RepID=A0A1F6NYT6_9BACT|nr:MAG: hypothetical protein ACD_72C00169G0007 [uncultured bacterium]OGH89087.1 MAG: hypothetical protein A2537_03425 [Candidatus Magasanikbacteria bacterium RIFOXYD2_FULL_36_9]
MISGLVLKLTIALLFGAAVGLERQGGKPGDNEIAGIRTYSLISLLGALCSIFYLNNLTLFAIIIAVAFIIILAIYFAVGSYITKDFGMTSELAILLTFLIGALTILEIIPMPIVMALFVVLILLLSLKSKTKALAAGISRQEINSFVSYAIIALVIMPFLPNVGYKLIDVPFLPEILNNFGLNLSKFANLELINPQRVWLVVALITGIDVFGYVLGRIIGQKGSFTLTSFVAGFISSTSTTQSLAQKSKKTGAVNYLVGAAVLANMSSFLQIFLLVGPLNGRWLVTLLPSLLIMILSATILSALFLKKKEVVTESATEETKEGKMFSLLPALKFAILLVFIKLITKICLILFGQSGFVVSSIIASLAGLDAVLVNLAEMAGVAITFKFATITFLLVNATNLMSKSVFSYLQGNRKFALNFFLSSLVIIAGSFVGFIFIK